MNFSHHSPKKPDFSKEADVIAWFKGEFRNRFDAHGEIRPLKQQVLAMLQSHPELVTEILHQNVDLSGLHDVVIIEKVKDGYDVYVVDRGKKVDVNHFNDLWIAVNEYLKSWALK